MSTSLRHAALDILRERDPKSKALAAKRLHEHLLADEVTIGAGVHLDDPDDLPGRPDKPEWVSPALLKRRSTRTEEGRAILLHALAHIEFNAINLALDAVWRFPDMPDEFYRDWMKVAAEESYHFTLLATRLAALDCAYGDYPAHGSLWEMAEKTRGDALARMALVPRTLEARGLDASPPIRRRLAEAGDLESAAILDIILHDEIGHVLIGNRWYRHLCSESGVDPHSTYERLALTYKAPKMRGPFNFEARREAGFDEAELRALANLDAPDAADAVA